MVTRSKEKQGEVLVDGDEGDASAPVEGDETETDALAGRII